MDKLIIATRVSDLALWQAYHVKQRIEELQLEWKKYYENLGFALISVPVGEEKLWAEKLAEEPMIRSAELNHKFNLLGSR